MVVTLEVTSSDMFKNLIARFKTTDVGCRWQEAALPQAIIPYCSREFIRLWYHMRSAFAYLYNVSLCTFHIFGYNTAQPYTMLFPWQFLVYKCTWNSQLFLYDCRSYLLTGGETFRKNIPMWNFLQFIPVDFSAEANLNRDLLSFHRVVSFYIRRYGPLLNAAFSNWPRCHNNCLPLV